ncbi:ribosome-binding factor A [Chloropicon primus]|uniref:Ribosome-binding factor A n=1 Tax=Chloropicon primus TaxID=1764295 RepID=A0A5B8MZK1_9CHLO|nr:ribosome-binding factor A [Chloropicon primus]UPR04054.1 ribosome-binding factor A [Chloropicon primus]|eukprot:QDZ24844.1 ribosome-binding factor A [Chloropicon primus]
MANLLCYDEVVLNAMAPYREYAADDEDILMAEVTEVVVSSDLQVAKVYVYLSGDDEEARMFAFDNLRRKEGYIRKELAQKVKMRRAPEVRLIYDKSVEEQEKLDDIFSDLRREREEKKKKEESEGDDDDAMELDLDDKEFLDNQEFYLDASAFPEPEATSS